MTLPTESEWVGAALTFARVVPLCGFVAASSNAIIPWPVAISVALSVAFPFITPVGSVALAALPFAVLRELAVGLLFALGTLLPVLALGFAARLAEHGGSPFASERPGPASRLYGWVAVATFLGLSGHRAVLMALSASFRDLPPGTAFVSQAFALGLAAMLAECLAFAFALALPCLLSVWVARASVSLSARVLSVRAVGIEPSLRGPLFILVCAALLAPLASRVPDAVRAGLATTRALIGRLGA